MNIKEEIKVIIARRGTTLKKVCEKLSEKTGRFYSYNNISNKLRNGTIKFVEVELIFDILNYKLTYEDLEK
ncbi:MAG: LLM class flavin-dependent oxidoreductase [bacterium]|nr:LLM class flavin-dependent oxidoreductase [bacterium]